MNQLMNTINSRQSIRKYDQNVKIDRSEVLEILQEAAQAPSSHNLQPWRFIIVDEANEKKELRQIAWGQEQIETSSATIAIIGDTEAYRLADKIAQKSVEEGLMHEEGQKNYVQGVNQLYPNAPHEALKGIAQFDGGLIAMQFMLIAKSKGYDTVCMGGFDKAAFAEKYNLDSRYVPLVLISLGKAAAPSYKTTRLNVEDLLLG